MPIPTSIDPVRVIAQYQQRLAQAEADITAKDAHIQECHEVIQEQDALLAMAREALAEAGIEVPDALREPTDEVQEPEAEIPVPPPAPQPNRATRRAAQKKPGGKK